MDIEKIKENLYTGHSTLSQLVEVYIIAGAVIKVMIENLCNRMEDYHYNSLDYALAIIDMMDHYIEMYEAQVSAHAVEEIQKSFTDSTGLDYTHEDHLWKYMDFRDERFSTTIYLWDTSTAGKYIKLREYIIAHDEDISSLKLDKYGVEDDY